MNTVLEVTGLKGGYGYIQILNGIDLHVAKGELVTIIGPNGCGKSTTIGITMQESHNFDKIVTCLVARPQHLLKHSNDIVIQRLAAFKIQVIYNF